MRAMSCGMSWSDVKYDLQIFDFFVRVYFDEGKPAFDRFSSYFPNPAKGLFDLSHSQVWNITVYII
jgi:hypothetical protein